MVAFSISAVVDGLIQLAAFLIVCAGLYLFLKLVAREKFEANFFRLVIVVGMFVLTKVYLTNQVAWAENIVTRIALLTVIVFLLMLQLLKTQLLVGLLAAMLLVAMGLGMERGAAMVSARVTPEGPTFAEYMGVAEQAIEKNKTQKNLKSTDVDVVDVMRQGLDALASLTQEDEMDVMKNDFNHGMALFAERKAWMDSLTPEEKQSYREELAAFLAEQGIAEDRYSLAAIQDVNPTNLVALADLFSDLQDDSVDEEKRIRSIPESIAQLTANFGGFSLDEKDRAMLQNFAELFGKDEMRQAVDQVREDLEAVQGDSEFLGTVLAAMMQAESGLPVDQMLMEDEGAAAFDLKSLRAMAASHWKREGKDPETEWRSFGPPEVVEVVEVAAVSAPQTYGPPADPFVRVTTRFGVALVPNDTAEIHSWIAAARGMELKGFVSLGDEVVILRTDGAMARKGEQWTVQSGGYLHHFKIAEIKKDRVILRANGREPAEDVGGGNN